MGFKIQEIKDKNFWENFLKESNEKTFLQSWNWGEFQRMMGNRIWRLGVYKNQQLVGIALIFKIEAKRGKFLFMPHGPAVAKATAGKPMMKYEVLKALLEELKKITRKEKASFIRIAPIWEKNEENAEIFKKIGFRTAPIHIHPELTWQLNIIPSEDELLMQMRKTTRYLIRQGMKNKDIEIIPSKTLEDIKRFNQLYQKTASRHHFAPFSLEYLKNEFAAFQPDNQIIIFLGKYKSEMVASGVFIFWQNIGFYHHGASSLKYPKIPVSYLLQWQAIKEAKRRGCKIYNFWGIAPDIKDKSQVSKSKHPWAGLTLFKMGFGGYKKEYLKTQDLPLSKTYWLTYIFEKLRKIKRGL